MAHTWTKLGDLLKPNGDPLLAGVQNSGRVKVAELNGRIFFGVTTGLYYAELADLKAGNMTTKQAKFYWQDNSNTGDAVYMDYFTTSTPATVELGHDVQISHLTVIGSNIYACQLQRFLYVSTDGGVSFYPYLNGVLIQQAGCIWFSFAGTNIIRGMRYGSGTHGIFVQEPIMAGTANVGDAGYPGSRKLELYDSGTVAIVYDGKLLDNGHWLFVASYARYLDNPDLTLGDIFESRSVTFTQVLTNNVVNDYGTEILDYGGGVWRAGWQVEKTGGGNASAIIGNTGEIANQMPDNITSILKMTYGGDTLGMLIAADNIYYSSDGGATWTVDKDFDALAAGGYEPHAFMLKTFSDDTAYAVVGDGLLATSALSLWQSDWMLNPPVPLPTPVPLGPDSDPNPGRMTLRWRDNNRSWFDEREVNLGATGDRFPMAWLHRLGMYRTRQWEIVCASGHVQVVTGLEEEVEVISE